MLVIARPSWFPLQTKHLCAGVKENFATRHRDDGPGGTVPLVDQAIRSSRQFCFLIPAIILPSKIGRPIKTSVAVPFPEFVGEQPSLELHRAEKALVIAE